MTRANSPLFFLQKLLASVVLAGCVTSCSNGNSGGNSALPTLALTPSSIVLTAGATGQQASLLLTEPTAGGMVTVTASGLPAGVTLSPATLSITPGAALPVTLTAAASAAATSTAAVTFATTVNGQAVSTQASLSVQAATKPADFSLSLKPTTVTLPADGVTPATVSVLATAQNGFSSTVQLTIAGLPSGVTAQPSSLALTPGTAATLTLTAARGTVAASSTATLTGTAGSLTHTAALAINVTSDVDSEEGWAVTPEGKPAMVN